uniref:Cytochrome c oxidase subunit 7A2, mitochondrial n=1 Tax=Astyanax mexicanus TaxID=7994 RepID=A0A3B1IDN0_ASTMX
MSFSFFKSVLEICCVSFILSVTSHPVYNIFSRYLHFRHVLQQVARRTLTTTAQRQVENQVPQKQKLFQADNGLPVHLKGGASDAVLYRATMGLTVMGTLFVLYELGKAALPQKKE